MRTLICIGSAAAALIAITAVRADEPAAPAAGASAATVVVAASAPARTQHCFKEYRVGSNFPVTRCEDEATTAESESERQQRVHAVQEEVHRSTTQIAIPGR